MVLSGTTVVIIIVAIMIMVIFSLIQNSRIKMYKDLLRDNNCLLQNTLDSKEQIIDENLALRAKLAELDSILDEKTPVQCCGRGRNKLPLNPQEEEKQEE